MKINYRLGVDPDLEKSGFAALRFEPFKKPQIIQLDNKSFFDLIYLIKSVHEIYKEETKDVDFIVCIEAGWLNKVSNYHNAFNKSIAAKIGKNVGENHAVGKLLELFCKENNIKYKLIKPTTSKWDARQFKMITGYSKRTNSEQRDAVRAAWL
jgi:hypothetical protein